MISRNVTPNIGIQTLAHEIEFMIRHFVTKKFNQSELIITTNAVFVLSVLIIRPRPMSKPITKGKHIERNIDPTAKSNKTDQLFDCFMHVVRHRTGPIKEKGHAMAFVVLNFSDLAENIIIQLILIQLASIDHSGFRLLLSFITSGSFFHFEFFDKIRYGLICTNHKLIICIASCIHQVNEILCIPKISLN